MAGYGTAGASHHRRCPLEESTVAINADSGFVGQTRPSGPLESSFYKPLPHDRLSEVRFMRRRPRNRYRAHQRRTSEIRMPSEFLPWRMHEWIERAGGLAGSPSTFRTPAGCNEAGSGGLRTGRVRTAVEGYTL